MATTAFKQVTDNAVTTTSTSYASTGVTSTVVASGTGTKFPTPGNGFTATIWTGAVGSDPGSDANMEQVNVISKSTDTFTHAATTKTHASPVNFALLNVSSLTTAVQTAINNIETGLPVGTIVGTSDTQTLTAKTLTTPLVTGSASVPSTPATGLGLIYGAGTTNVRPGWMDETGNIEYLVTTAGKYGFFIGFSQITTGFSTTATSPTQITGLTISYAVPSNFNRYLRITVYTAALSSTGGLPYITLWKGTVGSGTQIQQANGVTAGASATLVMYDKPTAGSTATYNAALAVASGTATFAAAAVIPGYITLEAM